jgi:hypothetical protein
MISRDYFSNELTASHTCPHHAARALVRVAVATEDEAVRAGAAAE